MHETDLELEPAEASDLCLLDVPELLAARGWDRALVTVLDEAPAERALTVLGHERGAEPDRGWHAKPLELSPDGGAGRTEDAEACARRAGTIYIFGSQFGSKDGPLQATRSWVARVREDDLAEALERGERPPIEIARLRFSLHRALNDALADTQVELLALGTASRDAYIDATIQLGAAKGKRWSGMVRSGDQPINVEGIEFRPDGRLLIGLRYPVTADGQPLLVQLDDVDGLFAEPETPPRMTGVWWLDGVGSTEQPVGVRALHHGGQDRYDAVVGNLDSAGKSAVVLADHPEGAEAASKHVRFALPLTAANGPVSAELVHEFDELRRVEGVAVADGHAHYVVDRDGHVSLRTLLLADTP